MKSAFLYVSLVFFMGRPALSQEEAFTKYKAIILRPDGNDIPFTILASIKSGNPVWMIQNAGERIELKNVHRSGDSLTAEFPVFESQLHFSVKNDGSYEGFWFKGSPRGYNLQKAIIYPHEPFRFKISGEARHTISGRWDVQFVRADHSSRPAIAEFQQNGNALTGTFITPSGDYRYLEGVVSGDSLMLSTFDGSHAFYFRAFIVNDHEIGGGMYYSGTAYTESWSAQKNENAQLPLDPIKPELKGKEDRLQFSFPDLQGKMVSIKDKKFKNKVVIIQLMGSWCSNCMDETAFMSEFYREYKNRGIEMIGLAYEYSTDPVRSAKSLQKFRDRFDLQYPILITGVTASDSLKTEKTLPELKKIESFPTTLILDKSGRLRKIHKGFNGPATGEHYTDEKKYFYKLVDELLAE